MAKQNLAFLLSMACTCSALAHYPAAQLMIFSSTQRCVQNFFTSFDITQGQRAGTARHHYDALLAVLLLVLFSSEEKQIQISHRIALFFDELSVMCFAQTRQKQICLK